MKRAGKDDAERDEWRCPCCGMTVDEWDTAHSSPGAEGRTSESREEGGLSVMDHCFREDNCVGHPNHVGPDCCCCGRPAEAHEGCDCE